MRNKLLNFSNETFKISNKSTNFEYAFVAFVAVALLVVALAEQIGVIAGAAAAEVVGFAAAEVVGFAAAEVVGFAAAEAAGVVVDEAVEFVVAGL